MFHLMFCRFENDLQGLPVVGCKAGLEEESQRAQVQPMKRGVTDRMLSDRSGKRPIMSRVLQSSIAKRARPSQRASM